MIRKALSIAMLLLTTLCMSAQMELPQLPLDPAVKSGKLANGLTYYILHNEHPKERANFYIAQKVGSTLETPTQLGLAHFLEHMAFNGSTNYPGKTMLEYLQSKGIRFGADINAYTDFDETVYNIDNVNTLDVPLMDSVLLVLRDWSCGILLEDAEIDNERGVIEEEWRFRNSAGYRMMESILPKIYDEYQYQQPVIGKMDIIRNFPYSEIKEYYKKWYRPDQQGIVIVGDFDAAEMEKKVVDLFSTIEMPANAAERTYPVVADNKEPRFAYFEDPETQFPTAMVSIKYDKLPREMMNTMAYVQMDYFMDLVSVMINNRLEEYGQKAECAYVYAAVSFGDFWVSKTKGAFEVRVIGKDGINKAFDEAMGIVARACKTGFTDSELSRARDEIMSIYEKRYNERGNTNSEVFAKLLYRHFIDNVPYAGYETDYTLAQQILPQIPVQLINQFASELITPENQVIVVALPKKEGMEVIKEQEFVGNLENILNADYEAYVDEVITDPLVSDFRPAGKVVSEKEGPFGTTELMLSNGVKVVVKPTDFKADEVGLTAFAKGGKQSYSASQANMVNFAEDVVESSKVGNFNRVTLGKYLAGKKVYAGYGIGSATNYISGVSTVKDLETFFELVYANFTGLNPDKERWASTLEQGKTVLKSQALQPQHIFKDHIYKTTYGNNTMMNQPTVEDLEKVDYEATLNFVKGTLSNAADFTFIITGNVNLETLRPLLEKYVASLPADPAHLTEVKKETSLLTVKGEVKDEWKQPMQAPATHIYNVISGTNIEYNVRNSQKVEYIGQLLRNIYIETLREEEGGTYTPSAYSYMSPITGEWAIVYDFSTNSEKQAKMISRADEELNKLLKNGTTAEAFAKIKEAALKQYENSIRTNGYWDTYLGLYYRGVDDINGAREAIENVTVEELNDFMKNLYDGKNRIQVIMEGVEAK